MHYKYQYKEITMSAAGKGSSPRPFGVDQQTFDANWDRIFQQKKLTESEKFDHSVMQDEYYNLDSEELKNAGC